MGGHASPETHLEMVGVVAVIKIRWRQLIEAQVLDMIVAVMAEALLDRRGAGFVHTKMQVAGFHGSGTVGGEGMERELRLKLEFET
jgi:hypothetical protein